MCLFKWEPRISIFIYVNKKLSHEVTWAGLEYRQHIISIEVHDSKFAIFQRIPLNEVKEF